MMRNREEIAKEAAALRILMARNVAATKAADSAAAALLELHKLRLAELEKQLAQGT